MFVVNGIGCLFNISLCFVFHTLALREELTQKTIAVLIGAPFPMENMDERSRSGSL